MLVTNNTNEDFWFGPLHLAAGTTSTLTVDDTSATSLYLTSDEVADAINNLYHAGQIAVSGAADPFPRPTGVPQLLHGDGSPEGRVFAPQGSAYMRRDSTNASSSTYVKTTGVTISTGWEPLAGGAIPSGTSFPGAPSDGDEYIYRADATNGVFWHFRYYTAGGYWAFLGGPPLYSEITTFESTTSNTYAALTTAGPSIALPFAADYDVEIGAMMNTNINNSWSMMSYDIGATGASDNDRIESTTFASGGAQYDQFTMSRRRRKTGLTAITLTAKYKAGASTTSQFGCRWMAVTPVKK